VSAHARRKTPNPRPVVPATIDLLVPTCGRPAALAVTLATLVGQTWPDFRVVVSDQTEGGDPAATPEVTAVVRVLRARRRRPAC
jgi:hypothetical protein